MCTPCSIERKWTCNISLTTACINVAYVDNIKQHRQGYQTDAVVYSRDIAYLSSPLLLILFTAPMRSKRLQANSQMENSPI